ncbi:MAG: lipopolysaccharide biosynthesis protein [Desulfobulbus sp.]|nr:lipopolysaccharide biosynthesis protein [Desulfobulbus sp.]
MQEFNADSSVKRVIKNSYYTAVRFAVYILSGVLFVPFLAKQYGNNAYGLIALAGFLTEYVGFITGCIGSSIGRYMNIALNKGDWNESNQIFSTALIAILVLIIVQTPFFVFGILKLEWLIDFLPEHSFDFRVLVGCKILTFLLSLMVGVIVTPLQAANRIDITIKIDIVSQVIRLILLFNLVLMLGPRLWIIGMVDLVLALLGGIVTFHFYRQFAPNLVFKRKHVEWKWIRPVMNMAVWNIVAGLGQILFQKTDVWIVNRFVSMDLAGICAVLLVWPNFVQQIAKNVSSVLQPVVMIDYAQGRFERIRDLVLLGTSLFSLLSLFLCGALMVFGGWLLELWMNESYRQYQSILILMLLHFPLTLSREAIWIIFPAFDKMEYLGVSNIVSGILNIVLSLVLVFMGYGLVGVVIATGISLILQRTLFLSYFVAKLLKIKFRQIAVNYLPGVLLVVAYGFQVLVIHNDNFLVIGIFCLLMACIWSVLIILYDDNVMNLFCAIRGIHKKRSV